MRFHMGRFQTGNGLARARFLADGRRWLAAGMLLLLAASAASLPVAKVAASIDAPQVVRARFIANSDDPADQRVKDAVRDAVFAAFGDRFLKAPDGRALAAELRSDLPAIAAVARDAARAHGADYVVRVTYENAWFPAKRLGDLTLPPGRYPALVVRLGAAKGHNWWGVLFPPLGLVDFRGDVRVAWTGSTATVDLSSLDPREVAAFEAALGRAAPDGSTPAFRLHDHAVLVIDETQTQDDVHVRWFVRDWFERAVATVARSWSQFSLARLGP